MYTQPIRSNDLYHHGILGQKWGVRRFQNPDGTLTAAGRRKLAKEYDYTQSDKYKNGSEATRSEMTEQHNQTKRRYIGLSKGQRNRIDYKVFEEGKDRQKVTNNEIAKIQVATLAMYAGYSLGHAAIKSMMNNGQLSISLNNAAVSQYASENGLNSVNGRLTSGINSVARGRKIMKEMLGI